MASQSFRTKLSTAWRLFLLNGLLLFVIGGLFLQGSRLWQTSLLLSLAVLTVLLRTDTRISLWRTFAKGKPLDLRWITWPFAAWLLAAMLIAWSSSQPFLDSYPRYNPLRFPAALSVLALTLLIRPKSNWLIAGLLIAAVASAVDGFTGWFIEDLARAPGNIGQPSIFGMWSMLVAMLLILFSALGTHWSVNRRICLLLAAALATFATFTTVTRAALLASGILGLMLLLLRKDRFHRGLLIAGAASMLIGFMLILASPTINKKLRVSEGVQDMSSATSQNYDTSLGARIVMWRVAWQMFERSPWVGLGPNAFQPEFKRMIESGKLPRVYPYKNAHSDVLHQLATGGLLGLLAYLGIIVGPLIFFGRALRHAGHDAHQRLYAAAGLLVTITFFWYGLTNATMYLPVIHSLSYPLLICALAAQLLPAASEQQPSQLAATGA
jgi:O-antigen ligase